MMCDGWRLETWSRSQDVSGDLFFGVSVSKVSGLVLVSKDFGLELFVSRLFIGYFIWSFARRKSLKNGIVVLENDCSKFNPSKKSVAMLSLWLRCLRVVENNLPSTPFKIYTEFKENVHGCTNLEPQCLISATRGLKYFAKGYLWTIFPRVLLWNL